VDPERPEFPFVNVDLEPEPALGARDEGADLLDERVE